MKNSIKTMFVVLAIVMTFIAVQAAQADTVTGTITTISTKPNMITVGEADVYGIRFNYLENKHDIVLTVNMEVSVEVYERYCRVYDTTKLMACEITVGDATVALRTCPDE
jgi:lipoprotein signal peptidase